MYLTVREALPMKVLNKIALSFVIFFSLAIIINIYLGQNERAQTNAIYLILNGFAYIISAIDEEKKQQSN